MKDVCQCIIVAIDNLLSEEMIEQYKHESKNTIKHNVNAHIYYELYKHTSYINKIHNFIRNTLV